MTARQGLMLPGTILIATLASGCGSNSLTLPTTMAPTLNLPATTASLGADLLAAAPHPEPPAEIYSRIARGALKCWFGPEGSLKQSHVFHAKVDPPSAGGLAEIAVHTRDPGGSSHGVLRAFAVSITPTDAGSLVDAQSLRFPEDQGKAMREDVSRWAAGKEGCSMVGTGGWGPAPTSPPEATAPPPKAKAHRTTLTTGPSTKQP